MKALDTDSFEDHDPVEEAAVAWLIERDEGFAPGRAAEFARWRQAHPRHAAAVERLEETWSMLEELPSRAGPAAIVIHPAARPAARWRVAAWLSLAAAAALVVGGVWWRNEARNPQAHYATHADTVQRISLPDGSVVTLNGNSRTDVQFAARERRVALIAGEAHFAVAPDPARPFLVTAGGVTVRAVGTAFNVRVATAEIEVVVESGKVRLTNPAGATDAALTDAPTTTPLLERGDRAVVPRGMIDVVPTVTRLEQAELSEALAWHHEMLVFAETPLREVVAQFNRRNRTQLRLGDASLGARLVGGTFAAENVDAFVSLLERGGDLKVERRGDREIILREAR